MSSTDGPQNAESNLGATALKPRRKIFYGWWIAIAAAVSNGISGGLYFYGFSTFFIPLEKEFGWSRAALSGAFSLSRLEGGLYGPLGGYMIDRFGPRFIMIIGIIVMSGGFFLLSHINSIVTFYIVFVGLISSGASFGTGMPPMITTAKWFVKKRGLAMGIALSGVGLGGLLLPVLGWVIENYGWRTASNMIGATILVVGLPLAFVMRQSPEKHGLLPDGDQPSSDKIAGQGDPVSLQDEKPSSEIEVNYTIRQALRTPVFWFLALAFGMRQLVVSAIALHQIPFLIDIGISQQTAATLLGSLAVISIVGRLGFGWMADRFEKRKLMAFSLFQLAIACLIFSGVSSLWQVILFLVIYSPAYGGGASMMFAIRGEYFGRASFGAISGLMDSFQMFGIVLGPLFAGAVYDLTGSYRIAFLIFAASAGISAVIMLFLKRPQLVQIAAQAT